MKRSVGGLLYISMAAQNKTEPAWTSFITVAEQFKLHSDSDQMCSAQRGNNVNTNLYTISTANNERRYTWSTLHMEPSRSSECSNPDVFTACMRTAGVVVQASGLCQLIAKEAR